MTSEIIIDDFLSDSNSLPCNCNNVPYAGKNNGHVETWDLRLNENKKLRKLFCKGARCKDPISRNLNDAKKFIVFGTDECVEGLFKAKSVSNNFELTKSKCSVRKL